MDNRISDMMAFLDASKSVYHAVDNLAQTLSDHGYTRLSENGVWNLVPGGKYYLTRGGSSLVAWRIPKGTPQGFLISASHSDRPSFKVRENGELVGKYTRLSVEKYGGMLMAPWLDRPLSVAGRALVETPDGVKTKLVDIDRDLMLMPNVAIHMNRQVNDGYRYNPATDTIPLLGGKDTAGKLHKELEEAAGGKILGHDLFLYVRQKSTVWGLENEYISSAALDDLQCVWSCTQGFLNSTESGSTPVLCVFDSEEIGSGSVQGAGSTLLPDILQRICEAMGWHCKSMLSQSFMLSADNAHAVHPNHPELADPAHAPVINGGIVLKFNAALRYTTDGVSAAIFRKVCQKANVPVQTYCNRPDIPGGSTLGRISLGKVSIPTADIGLAQLAMHSSYETAGVTDTIYLMDAMSAYYSSTLTVTDDGAYHLK